MAVATAKRPKTTVDKIGHRILQKIKDGMIVIFSDAHWWPGDNSPANQALIRLIKKERPSVVIANGDSFDGASVSRHPKTDWYHPPNVKEELEYCQEKLGEIQDAARGAVLIHTFGNHDQRFASRLAQVASEYAGVPGTDLTDHFPDWSFCWSAHINQNANGGPQVVVKHDFKGGTGATFANARDAGCTMVTGHLHQLKVTPYSDYNGRRYGVDCGTLSNFGPTDRKFGYGKDNPFCWGQGFVTLEWRDGLLLPPDIAEVFPNGKVFWRGKTI